MRAMATVSAATVSATPQLQPSLFLSHGGGPCFFMKGGVFKPIDSESPAADFLRSVAATLPQQPSAVIIISAHWEGEGGAIEINTTPTPGAPLLYDYYGFPAESYEIQWPSPNAPPELAARVASLLKGRGFKVVENRSRGFDHGVFVPLGLVFPDADVPTLQVSLHGDLGAASHIELGRALAPLRAENILIIGSGFLTHNLREISRDGAKTTPVERWAAQFTDWVSATLLGASARGVKSTAQGAAQGTPVDFGTLERSLTGAATSAPHFARAHPRVEHWIPILVALGAADPAPHGHNAVHTTEMFAQIVMGTAALNSFRFDTVTGRVDL